MLLGMESNLSKLVGKSRSVIVPERPSFE